jgi:hypothetical protein
MDEKPKWTDKAIVILTGGIVFLAGMQWYEMCNSGMQTDKIIAADERLAKANERFATSMETTATNSKTAFDATLAEMQKQSGAMRDAAGASKSQSDTARNELSTTIDNARFDQRAWLGIADFKVIEFEKGKTFKVDVGVSNSGKTPALDISQASNYILSPTKILGPDSNALADAPFEPMPAVAPQGHMTAHFGMPWDDMSAHYDAINKGTEWLYFFGEIRYTDTSHTVKGSTKWCLYVVFTEAAKVDLYHCQNYDDLK